MIRGLIGPRQQLRINSKNVGRTSFIRSMCKINTSEHNQKSWERVKSINSLIGFCAMRHWPKTIDGNTDPSWTDKPICVIDVSPFGHIIYKETDHIWNDRVTDRIVPAYWDDGNWIIVPDYLCNDTKALKILLEKRKIVMNPPTTK